MWLPMWFWLLELELNLSTSILAAVMKILFEGSFFYLACRYVRTLFSTYLFACSGGVKGWTQLIHYNLLVN